MQIIKAKGFLVNLHSAFLLIKNMFIESQLYVKKIIQMKSTLKNIYIGVVETLKTFTRARAKVVPTKQRIDMSGKTAEPPSNHKENSN